MNPLVMFIKHFFVERPPRGKTAAQLADELEASGRKLMQRFQSVPQTEANHRIITHIIGIEKWGQLRIQVAQGAPFREEEYDVHRPPRNTSWDELIALFEKTRRETVALARGLSQAQLAQKVRHNTFEEITVAGWLHYLNGHGLRERLALR